MRTDDIAFEQQITALTANLNDLPESARASIEGLIEETRNRHEANRTNIAHARSAAARLDAVESLHDVQMQGISTQLTSMQDTLRQV